MRGWGYFFITGAIAVFVRGIFSEHFWSDYLPIAVVLFLIGFGLYKLDDFIWDRKISKEIQEEQKAKESAKSNFVDEKIENNEQEVEVPSSETLIETETNTWKCPNCGEINGKKFCKECGTEKPVIPVIKDRFCTNCGTKLKEHQKFCGKCGTKVDNE